MILIYYLFIIIFIFIIINSYLSNKELFSGMRRNNYITTWTPYAMDCYNQPSYSNYFYNNGYMYPIY
jgi:hypothetical protein